MRSRNPWCWCWQCRVRRRRRLAAGLVILIAVAGLAAHENTQSHHTRPAPARTIPAPRPSSAHPKHRAPATSPATLEADAGQGLSWVSFHGMQLPVSATAGPHDTRGGLASGFADTPQGALVAAINIGLRTAAQWGSTIFVPTITRQITGPNAKALLHAEETAYAQLRAATHVRAGQPTGQGYAAEDGYRFTAWSPDAATIDVVTIGPTASGATVLAVTRVQVVWQHGDWRVIAPPGGNWANAATAISSPAGYTIFPGR
jgi:hypothetical protein